MQTPQQLRQAIWLNYIAQATAALAGAVCLYSAIDNWLIGRPFWSAVMTALAFWNGHNFVQHRLRQHRGY
jgi:hypothetical protein